MSKAFLAVLLTLACTLSGCATGGVHWSNSPPPPSSGDYADG